MTLIAVIGILLVVLVFRLGSASKIEDNVSAASMVTVGMTLIEVNDLIIEPNPPWSVLSLMEWTEGASVPMDFSREGGQRLVLTPDGADITNSTYYAWVFFPTKTRSSEPTFVVFRSEDDTVAHVARFDCDFSLAALELGGLTGAPIGSPCRP